ncbi:MAG: tetratricopeptide repeat protein [Anaerolineae bacterium]|nr:tetratricopeptide repeat protein [Anaerolineae bacterium]
MASLLHQAVEHAQAGRRDEARRLLQEYLQSSPDNEVAWLWLASVAADQAEYQRALREVLRVNPANQQARALLDQFQQQYGSRPPAPPVAMPAPETYAPPPPRPVSYEGLTTGAPGQDPYRQYAPPSPLPYSQYAPLGQPLTPSEVQRVQVEHVERKQRGLFGCGLPGCSGCLGCSGCWGSCLLALVVMIVVPVLLVAVLVLAVPQAQPVIDVAASFLPGETGRKTVVLSDGSHDVSLTVPRSWYVADADNDKWRFARDVLNETLKFDDEQRTWQDFESASPYFTLVEVNPVVLTGAYSNGKGAPILLTVNFAQPTGGDFSCSAVRAQQSQSTIYEYAGGLCGYRSDVTPSGTPGPIFRDITAPTQWTRITFVTPITGQEALQWTLELPADLLDHYRDDLQALIESVEIRKL